MKKSETLTIVFFSILTTALLMNFRIATLCVWIFSAYVICNFVYNFFRKKEKKIFFHPIFAFALLIFITRIIFFFFFNPTHAKFVEIEETLPLLIFPIAFCLQPVNNKVFKTICKITVSTYLLISLCFLVYFAVWYSKHNFADFSEFFENKKYWAKYFLNNPFAWHPTFFCVNLCMIFPMLYVWFKDNSHFWLKILLQIPVFAIVLIISLITGSRTGVLVAVCVFFALLVFQIKVHPAIQLSIFAFPIIIIMLAANIYDYKIEDKHRDQMIVMAKTSIKELPFFGKGPEPTFYPVEEPSGIDPTKTYIKMHSHPHNQFYSDIVHYGFIGFLPLILLLMSVVVTMFYKKFNNLLFFWLLAHLPLLWIDCPLEFYGGIAMTFWLCFFATQSELGKTVPKLKS